LCIIKQERPMSGKKSLAEQNSILSRRNLLLAGTTVAAASALSTGAMVGAAQAQQSGKPNILVIMGDDVGWFNIGAYHQGIMSGKTPNLDKLAADGMRFTDYYAEASCTAGRANFITGQIPLRTGLTTVGQAGADVGMPEQSVTTALILKSMGYATGQFGKNHLGDLNKYLPTLHGFDEFFGYLYHLDAMSDPYWFDYPQDWIDKYGPRNLVHSYATDTDDATVMPRWGKVGKQRIVDEGPLKPFKDMSADHQMWQKGRDAKYDMETFDEVLVDHSKAFMDQAKAAGKPFFIWHNTTRMHVFTYLSQKYQAKMNYQSNFGLEEAGMAQMDDDIGDLLKHLDDIGVADNTIVIFTTDNGAEVFTWPDGGMTPFRATKGTVFEGGFRVPCIARWPGKIKPGTVQKRHLLRARLAADAGRCGGQSEHHPAAAAGAADRRQDLQEPFGWVQPDGPADGKRTVGAARSLLFRRVATRRHPHRRFQIPILPAALRMARREGDDRHADDRQSAPGSVRADAVDPRPDPQ
jgi:arylsulfatase A-like enzyme